MKLIFLSFLLLLLSFQSVAQEVDIAYGQYMRSDYYYSPRFNDRYISNNYYSFSLQGTAFYQQKKVKRVEIIDPYSQLFWMIELDREGKILKTGIKGNPYFTTTQRMGNQETDTTITCYFQNDQLMKVDTSIVYVFRYTHGDTTVSFNRTITKTYKLGSLINEQNAYYNEKYLNKPLLLEQEYPMLILPVFVVDRKGRLVAAKNDGPQVYLSEKLKADYDTSKLYLCQSNTVNSDLYATGDGGQTDLPLKQLQKHAFYKYCQSGAEINSFTDGEDFNEPSESHRAMFCGSMLYNNYDYNATKEGYVHNENGLRDFMYSDFYPLDTAKTEAVKIPVDPNGLVIYQNPSAFHYQSPKRVSTPERIILFRFRYEYFEEEID